MTTTNNENDDRLNEDDDEESRMTVSHPADVDDETSQEASITWNHQLLMSKPPSRTIKTTTATTMVPSQESPAVAADVAMARREEAEDDETLSVSTSTVAVPGTATLLSAGHSAAVVAMGELLARKPTLTKHYETIPESGEEATTTTTTTKINHPLLPDNQSPATIPQIEAKSILTIPSVGNGTVAVPCNQESNPQSLHMAPAVINTPKESPSQPQSLTNQVAAAALPPPPPQQPRTTNYVGTPRSLPPIPLGELSSGPNHSPTPYVAMDTTDSQLVPHMNTHQKTAPANHSPTPYVAMTEVDGNELVPHTTTYDQQQQQYANFQDEEPLFTPPRSQQFKTVPVSPLATPDVGHGGNGSSSLGGFFDQLLNGMNKFSLLYSNTDNNNNNKNGTGNVKSMNGCGGGGGGDIESNCNDWASSMLLGPSMIIPLQRTPSCDFVLDGMENVVNNDDDDNSNNNDDDNGDETMFGSETSLDFYAAMNGSDNKNMKNGDVENNNNNNDGLPNMPRTGALPPHPRQRNRRKKNNNRNSSRQSVCRASVASVTALQPPEEKGDPDDSFLWLFHDKEEFMDLVQEVTHFGKNQNWKKKILGVCLGVVSVCVFCK